MLTAPPPLSWGPTSSFRYIGGDPSLDLVNTAAWTGHGLVNDRLTDYGRLTSWAAEAGVITEPERVGLQHVADVRPEDAAAACRAARALRWVLQRLYAAVAAGAPIEAALEPFNAFVADAYAHVRLAAGGPADRAHGRAVRWAWENPDDRLDAILWPVVRGAGELLASPEAARVRVCGGEDCGWMYVDRSRNGLRRWCEMATCGTQAKTRRRARRAGSMR